MDELCKLLPRFLNKHVRGDHAPVLEVLGPLWPRVAGKVMAEQSRPVAFGNGTLTLAASSAPWATELRGLHHEIRTAINRTLGRPLVKRVLVRLAPISSSHASLEVTRAFGVGPGAPAGNPAFRMLATQDPAPTASANEKEFGLQTGLDAEIREVLLRSFAKYFGRANGRVN
jgi:Dna[CI] antecedent, DciA